MKRVTLAAAAAATLLSLAACGQSPASSASGAGTSSAPSCRQQYETWKHGVAAQKVKADLKGLEAAGSAGDIPKLESALRAVGKDAAALRSDRPPHCADPKGYYEQILARIIAGADNLNAASGIGGLMLAEAPLKTIPALGKKLNAELNKTVGSNY